MEGRGSAKAVLNLEKYQLLRSSHPRLLGHPSKSLYHNSAKSLVFKRRILRARHMSLQEGLLLS